MITRAVVGADTIEKGCIYVEDGIRKKKTIPRIEVSNFMQKRTATPQSQGSVDVDGRVLTPQDLMLYYEFNPRDYEQHFYAEQLQPKLLGRELPVTAENFMMMQTMKRLNEFFENAIWRSRLDYDADGAAVDPTTKGDSASASAYFYFDGLIKKALDGVSASTYPTISISNPKTLVAGTAGSGEENVGDAFQRCYAALATNANTKALLFKYGEGGLKFHVSYATQQVYEAWLTTTATYKNNDYTEKGINRFKGYEIKPLAGMPDNTIVLCISKPDIDSNLWLGINSTEDNQLQLMRLQNNSELFFVKGLFKMDTQIGFTDQLVIYTTLTA
jgi:hypothetical protein